MKITKRGKFSSFLSTQMKFSVFLISVCALVMGILSNSFIRKDAITNATETNNEMLYQYRNTIDNFLLNIFNEMSIKLLDDLNTVPELKYYVYNSLKGNIVDTIKVSEYMKTYKNLNSMLYSVAVYYKQNKLLISNDFIRYTFENVITDKMILYYDNLLETMIDTKGTRYGIIADSGEKMFPDYLTSGRVYPDNVINIIRIIPDNQGSYISLFITVDSNVLHNIVKKYTPDNLESVMIIDESGMIISHTDSKYIGKSTSEFEYLNNLDGNKESGNITRLVNNIPTVISYQTSELSGWKYIAFTPMSNIYQTTQNIFKTIIYIAIFTIILCIMISLLAAKRIARPIRQLATKCRQSPYFKGIKGNNEYLLINSTLDDLAEIMARKEMEMKEITPLLTVNFITWLFSSNVSDVNEINKKMDILKIKFTFNKFCIMAVKIKSTLKDFSGNDKESYSYEYERARTSVLLEDCLNTNFSRCIIHNKEDEMVLFINYDCNMNQLEDICEEVFEEDSNGYTHYLAFGSGVDNIAKIADSYKAAFIGVEYSYFYPERHIFTFDEIIRYENSNSSNLILLNNLINSLKSENCEKIVSDFDSIINMLRANNCSLGQMKSTLVHVASLVNDFINNKPDQNSSLMSPMEKFSDIADFSIQIKALISDKFMNNKTDAGNVSNTINSAKKNIEENLLNSQLSLESVAKDLCISSNYLSRIFRNECNITFIEYVTSLKMQKGRKLLLETEMTIDEISRYLGYSTAQYFISKFKRNFGLTPNAYKCRYKVVQTG